MLSYLTGISARTYPKYMMGRELDKAMTVPSENPA
jgi:hypothetical protein